ncbi:MAG TPA: hypothetical protein DEO70_02995 [Bacteroidales bacterium]|nr:MAG: hypothetical protein A2X11_09465 [Bacteroidetes bacterium GWE2_42_24]OFY25765.1 MAG: hypothetical protein A2X09_09285 [Bacteroidetes bacterium GWF2_43_11]HBZ65777.1 hypothetical protein [Bacteroidales bacterium]
MLSAFTARFARCLMDTIPDPFTWISSPESKAETSGLQSESYCKDVPLIYVIDSNCLHQI